MAILSKPITDSKIAGAVGMPSKPHDLGRMITQGNINKWSFCKPIRYSNINELTNQNFYDVNDGFDIVTLTNGVNCYAVSTALSGWTYQKPRGANYQEMYRYLDFNGYNPDALSWFNTDFVGQTTVEKGGDAMRVQYNNAPTQASGANVIGWILQNFAKFKPLSGSKYEFGFILKSKTANLYYYYKTGDIVDILDEPDKRFSIVIPAGSDIAVGNYYLSPVLKNYNSGVASQSLTQISTTKMTGQWIPMPMSPYEIEILAQGQIVINNLYIDTSALNYSVTVNPSTYQVTINYCTGIKIINNNAKSVTVRLTIAPVDYYSGTYPIYDDDITLAAGAQRPLDNLLAGKQYISATGQPTIKITLTYYSLTKETSVQLWDK